MYHKRWALAGAAVTALSVLAGLAMAAPAAAAAGWTRVSVPQTGNNTELNAVSARTSTDAWAVGVQFGAAGQTPPPPVAYRWTGSAWSLTATPSLGVNAGLNAVSASSASDAWAVGFTLPSGYRVRQPLYEHWNGSAWSVVSGPGLGLNGVADLSPANAWAVGIRGTVEHWNGTAWSNVAVPSPNPSYPAGANLNAITAISASDIWAVGSFYNASFTISAFALHYNGTAWSVTVLPQPAVTGPSSPILHGVTAVASNNVWAVGENEEVPGLGITTLIEHRAQPDAGCLSHAERRRCPVGQRRVRRRVQRAQREWRRPAGTDPALERQHLVGRHRSDGRDVQPAVRGGDAAGRRQRVGGRHQRRRPGARPQPRLIAQAQAAGVAELGPSPQLWLRPRGLGPRVAAFGRFRA
jgi:hypothetical protein